MGRRFNKSCTLSDELCTVDDGGKAILLFRPIIDRGCDRRMDHRLRLNIGHGCDRRKDHRLRSNTGHGCEGRNDHEVSLSNTLSLVRL